MMTNSMNSIANPFDATGTIGCANLASNTGVSARFILAAQRG